jgi:hypothetical protein
MAKTLCKALLGIAPIIALSMTAAYASEQPLAGKPTATHGMVTKPPHEASTSVGAGNSVPSYLMRNDGVLINGLLPTSPDAQG